jgi:thiol-disulfide isomerase/thioredoxin
MTILEKITHISLIAVCCLAASVILHDQVAARSVPAAGSAVGDLPLDGSTVTLKDISWTKSTQTVVLFMSAHCHWCQKSVPLYQAVSALHKTAGGFQFVVVSNDPPGQTESFLKENSIEVDKVLSPVPGSLGIRGTPTILLVDQSGKVSFSHKGMMAKAIDDQFLKRLAGKRG